MNRGLVSLAVLGLLGLTACKGVKLGPYTSPVVTGRVVNAETQQPIENARVWRDLDREPQAGLDAAKGGELLKEKPPVVTGPDGAFRFPSQRALTLFHTASWNWAQISIEASGFQRLHTNFTILAPSTNLPSGEPWLDAGDIKLKPSSK